MSYAEQKKEFLKEKFWYIEIDLDYCDNTYGVAPCTAAVGVTGDIKCFNTNFTCQDKANYAQSPKTYKFCTAVSPLPEGLDAIPSLLSAPTINAVKFNPAGGLGVNGGITLKFKDGPSNDVGLDKYVNERTYIPYETGTYWGKLRARSPNYNNREIRAYSGYLVDGQFDIANFEKRTYVIDQIDAQRGVGMVKGKDVLKLASDDRSQYPVKSTGELLSDLDDSTVSFALSPAGVGDLEYDASGWVRLSDEVMSFTRVADIMTVVRGQYTTAPTGHASGDLVQQCKYFNDRVDSIVNELLTVGSNIDPVFIPLADWGIEIDDNYPYMFETLLTESIGVEKLLKELAENAPHSLNFNEVTQLIEMTALKEPPININYINNQEHIVGTVNPVDMPEMRVSQVFVRFGQRDPTKKLDELNNYSQTYVRNNLASSGADEYGSEKIETINSRWINNFNKAAAVELAAKKGRRFEMTPRQISYKVTAKDSDLWIGDNIGINHPELQLPTGEQGNNIYQIMSVQEAGDFNYTALEYTYGAALPDDPDAGIDLVILGGNVNDINLRTIYDSIFPAPTDTSIVKFIIDNGVEVGSTSISSESIDTGSWPALMAPVRIFIKGTAAGKGGDAIISANGEDGGLCLLMNHDVTIEDVTGLLGGGGGGGGSAEAPLQSQNAIGGGGAGITNSFPDGGNTTGGAGQTVNFEDGGEPQTLVGGGGGGLGEDGEDGTAPISTVSTNLYVGGLAGAAIDTNGYNLIITNGATNIKGAIL